MLGVFLWLGMFGNALLVQGQSEAESENILLLQPQSGKARPRYIKAGKSVVYWEKGGEKVKGQLDRITDSTFIVSGRELYPEELEKIMGKSAGIQAAKVGGAVAVVVGAGSLALGYACFVAAEEANDCGASFGYAILGVLLVAAGISLFIFGLIPFAFRNKRYDLLTKWKLSITQTVPRNRARTNTNGNAKK